MDKDCQLDLNPLNHCNAIKVGDNIQPNVKVAGQGLWQYIVVSVSTLCAVGIEAQLMMRKTKMVIVEYSQNKTIQSFIGTTIRRAKKFFMIHPVKVH